QGDKFGAVGGIHDRLPANNEHGRGGPSPSPPPSSPGGPRSQPPPLRRCRRRARVLGWRGSWNVHRLRRSAARLFSLSSSHGQKPSGLACSINNRSRSAAASMSPMPSDRGTQNPFSDASSRVGGRRTASTSSCVGGGHTWSRRDNCVSISTSLNFRR